MNTIRVHNSRNFHKTYKVCDISVGKNNIEYSVDTDKIADYIYVEPLKNMIVICCFYERFELL